MLNLRHFVPIIVLFVVASSLALSGGAAAQPADDGQVKSLWAERAPKKVRIDGMPKEWTGKFRTLSHRLRGSEPTTEDLQARALIAYDDNNLYVVADVTDDKLVGGGDCVELVLGIPGGRVHSVRLYPGVAGKSRGMARNSLGLPIRGARVVEAPTDQGYHLESQIPWKAFRGTDDTRIGLRGAILVHDADRSRAAENIVGTAPSRAYRRLPAISTEPELALGRNLLWQKQLLAPPKYNLLANVAGDKFKERILVYGRYLVVLGYHYRNGREYYFRDLGVDAYEGGLPSCEVRDLTGDGRGEVVLRSKYQENGLKAERLDVLSFGTDREVPEPIFAHEITLQRGSGKIANAVSLKANGTATSITITPGRATGIGAGKDERDRFARRPQPKVDAALLPWGPVTKQVYSLNGGRFVLADETRKPGSAPTSTSGPPLPPPPPTVAPPPPPRPPKTVGAGGSQSQLAQVYAHYRKTRKVRGKARFDLRANLAGDRRRERLLLHGRDLVAFGEGFRQGRGYAVASLSMFEKDRDISSVKVRDVTGDGRSEIIIAGTLRTPAPEHVKVDKLEHKVVLIYQLHGNIFRSIFAAELERIIGKKRIVGSIRYGAKYVELRRGRAVGYTEKTYPFGPKATPNSDVYPVLLPWNKPASVRYRWNGQNFEAP